MTINWSIRHLSQLGISQEKQGEGRAVLSCTHLVYALQYLKFETQLEGDLVTTTLVYGLENIMFGRLVIFALLAIAVSGCAVHREEEENLVSPGTIYTQSKAVMETVLLGAEYGSGGAISRYTRSPRISIFNADINKRGYVNSALGQINAAINGSGIQVSVGAENDRSADILIYYAPMSSFAQIARDNGFTYSEGNSGFFWSFWGPNREITKSIVMIATDVLSAYQLQSVTLEELTQCMGAVNDQSMIYDSIFYESAYDSGYATQYGAFDFRLLGFLYKVLQPGYTKAKVDYLFDVYWTE